MKQLSTNVSEETYQKWVQACEKAGKSKYVALREFIEYVLGLSDTNPLEAVVLPKQTDVESSGTTVNNKVVPVEISGTTKVVPPKQTEVYSVISGTTSVESSGTTEKNKERILALLEERDDNRRELEYLLENFAHKRSCTVYRGIAECSCGAAS